MKKSLLVIIVSGLALLSLISGVGAAPQGLQLAGATWYRLPQAQALARQQHKPILLLQMFGELDERWC